ncbi:HNH endonuclease [Microbacterium sp. Leaf159]|uniref:HNH endonuclease n=1 Tax=Microbacterium sp. Leaf159 TaxID=1736279 RepID=UPI000B268202|nr:HNH endonuclease [Microbacterium sp. Leaf159]
MSQHHNSTRADRIAKKKLKDECKAADLPCWLSGCTIDYDTAWNDLDNPRRFQRDHFFRTSTHLDLYNDPSNWRPSFADCNDARGNSTAVGGLGIPSRQWRPSE